MNATQTLEAALSDLKRRLDESVVQVRDLETKLAAAKAKSAHARGAIEHIEGLLDDRSPLVAHDGNAENAERIGRVVARVRRANGGQAPEGMEAVAIALKQSPVPLTLDELTDAVVELGWHPETTEPGRAVRAAGNRLRRKDPDFDYFSKRWAYMPNHADQLPPRLGGVGAFDDGNEP